MAAAPHDDLASWLAARKRRVEDAVASSVPALGTPPATLHEALRYTLLLPGKRLRGIVTLAAFEALRGDAEDAVPLAAAVEMVHASSLILDDLPSMDDATLRRGKPTPGRRRRESTWDSRGTSGAGTVSKACAPASAPGKSVVIRVGKPIPRPGITQESRREPGAAQTVRGPGGPGLRLQEAGTSGILGPARSS